MAAEKNFENKVKEFLGDYNAWFIKYWSGRSITKKGVKKFTRNGIPDILCSLNGYFLGIEVKGPDGKPSELQLYHLAKIDKSGGYGILLYPKDFETFRYFVDALSRDNRREAEKYYKKLKPR